MKFGVPSFLDNLSTELKFHQNLTRITCILREEVFIFVIICDRIFLNKK
jgi:hypothetical protein